MAQTKTIEIDIKDGEVKVYPESYTLKDEEAKLKFWSDNHNFAVSFGLNSPFYPAIGSGKKGGKVNGVEFELAYDPETSGGVWAKYTVAVWDSANQKVKMKDPDIIIPPRKKGG